LLSDRLAQEIQDVMLEDGVSAGLEHPYCCRVWPLHSTVPIAYRSCKNDRSARLYSVCRPCAFGKSAFEATRYLPICDLLRDGADANRVIEQPPVFVGATAINDRATCIAFPIGNAYCLLTEGWRGIEERQAMINTIGHLDRMTTHDLKMIDASPGFELTSRDPGPQQPYWVVSAKPAVTDGHFGIFQAPFLKFLAALVIQTGRKKPGS
jgi:hypothetical protein